MAYSILVVDDSKIVQKVMERTLHLTGVPIDNVFFADNGKEALDILEREWIDIVFADINMPVMTGVEMIQEMAKRGTLNTVPVVVVSSDGSEDKREKLQNAGVNEYVRKPFSPELIRNIINNLLKKEE